MSDINIRKATLRDAPGIQKLVHHYAQRQFMLPRTLGQVFENLRDFIICEQDGQIVGCGALHIWSDMAEVRSLAVAEGCWRQGIGKRVVNACLDEGRSLGVKSVFVLTYQPEFFEKIGFRRTNKESFPQKIWVDCAHCPRFPNCNEIALLMELEPGSSPSTSHPK